MPGDELHENAAAGARSGPRHAAPKKPLLTRFHVPAGKAIAIAAMPSAVLMGMGFTPQLAVAKPAPESPFKDGPCVTAPDKQEREAQAEEKAAKEKAAKDKAAKEKAAEEKQDGRKAGEDGKAGKTPGAGSPSPGASPSPSGSPSGNGGSGASPSTTPSPSPSTDDDGNPWYDPLGWGKKIEDALTPGGAKDTGAKDGGAGSGEDAASPSPSTTPDAGSSKDPGKPGKKVTDPVRDTVDKVTKPVKDAADEATGKQDDDATPTPTAGAGAPDADGKKPFPCVVEKKSDGTDEQPPSTVPNDPWHLEATSLTLKELDYKGVVNLRTPNGRTKQALKFTAGGIDIGDLHQIVDGPNGLKYHVRSTPGSTSTIRDGQVTLYTERLQGNLFGLIPIVFDPEHPPPINVPFAYFTKVKLAQAGQFGGTLHVPGLHETIEKN
ncbi:hypothetical protein ACGH2B_06905 [Streptomyces sp. BBFR2]|uniref:hypothetical protein n=1 Tax=Streptomyces sp. BBFR2 TaxID=3372854 RepID=UPI0037D9FD50